MSGKMIPFPLLNNLSFFVAKRGIDSKDYFILTIQIPLLHRLNSIISSNIVNFKCSFTYPHSSM